MLRETEKADETVSSCQIYKRPLYLIGTFDRGVTVLSQQTRALNLVWGLTETGAIATVTAGETPEKEVDSKIAIIGGGFSGLSAAAALIAKGVKSEIYIFEQRDTLFPLQHGSDTRWLHPHIYNWPSEGSQVGAANLPILNWTAARASDVVVQVMSGWTKLVADHKGPPISLFCNTRHLQIHEVSSHPKKLRIEWIGEKRRASTGTADGGGRGSATGERADFDAVILAVGFGLEVDSKLSYWRNDMIGQPNLEQPRSTFLLSGQGDGAMIDLLRLRISHYRQDRILWELFENSPLLKAVSEIYQIHHLTNSGGIFEAFETLDDLFPDEMTKIIQSLSERLRRDTDVILHLKLKKLSELFDSSSVRISFQNKLLVYLLYRCGGFVPSTESERAIVRQHSIPAERVIRRHGTNRDMQLANILSPSLITEIQNQQATHPLEQADQAQWTGGYFGFTGPASLAASTDPANAVRRSWRKEYLPGPTALLATAFCSSLAGLLIARHPPDRRLRITLHRAVNFGSQEVLQQCCRYFGLNIPEEKDSSAGRTFPAENATIGLAYKCRKIVRTKRGVQQATLADAMNALELSAASYRMLPTVKFVMSIPILTGVDKNGIHNPVAGVVYIDSEADDFFPDGERMEEVVSMVNEFCINLEKQQPNDFDRISNRPLSRSTSEWRDDQPIPEGAQAAFEFVEIPPPSTRGGFQFNLEHSDFMPVGT